MRNTLRRLPLADGISLAIPATILALALGSNWSPSVRSVAGPLRWVGLLVVCVLALDLINAPDPSTQTRTSTSTGS